MNNLEWHDVWRLLVLLISLRCLFLLGLRFAKHSSKWNTKTRDYWFAMVMWCVAGVAIPIEGILRDSPIGGRLVFLTMASVVTLKALVSSGAWGEGNDS